MDYTIYSKINGYLCGSKKKKVKSLVIYICSVLLMILAQSVADKQGNATWQKSMPQNYTLHYICAEQPIAERTINHLSNKRIAMPILTIGEIPGFHPHPSKTKCLHTTDRLNHYNSYISLINGFTHHPSPIQHHVIDYYIYTLEHILI